MFTPCLILDKLHQIFIKCKVDNVFSNSPISTEKKNSKCFSHKIKCHHCTNSQPFEYTFIKIHKFQKKKKTFNGLSLFYVPLIIYN